MRIAFAIVRRRHSRYGFDGILSAGDEASIIMEDGQSDSQAAVFIISYIIVVNWTLVQVPLNQSG